MVPHPQWRILPERTRKSHRRMQSDTPFPSIAVQNCSLIGAGWERLPSPICKLAALPGCRTGLHDCIRRSALWHSNLPCSLQKSLYLPCPLSSPARVRIEVPDAAYWHGSSPSNFRGMTMKIMWSLSVVRCLVH
jgi:hypothetical protein